MLTKREFILRLSLCPGIGPVAKWRLFQTAQHFNGWNHLALLLERTDLKAKTKQALIQNWYSFELQQAVQLNMKESFVTILDPQYPVQLAEIYCPPLLLFYRGKLELIEETMLGVVGARQMTPYGRKALQMLIPDVVANQVTVVSGLAAGVDGFSHDLTLQHGGHTVAVIGTGLDQTYPRHHQRLQEVVTEHGLLLSEYGLGTVPFAWHFPERNRIIAGLAEAVLVVEARKKSGSLITANLALNENRNVCAVPGRIDAPFSTGCNELIKAGATPVLDSHDLLNEFRTC